VATELLDRVRWGGFGPAFDRAGYTAELTGLLVSHAVDLVAMAGFGTVLGPDLFDVLADRIVNTHPALLPAHKGWHAVEEALEAGDRVTGCTVHVATREMDAGPVLAQEEVAVLPGDTVPILHERIKAVERRLYPATILRLLEARAAGSPPDGHRTGAAPDGRRTGVAGARA
jgi:phosphoribosylglycinamide formyltransferase-1